MSYLYTMLENEEFVEMPEVEEDSIAEDTSEEVQDLEGISAAAEVTSDQIDAAEEVAADIEESVTEEGRGMDAVTAYHIGKRMEAIMAISREKPRRSITVENFDHAGGRHSYTMQALADVKDTIKRWWKKLKDLVMKYVDKVVDLWNKYVSDVARLRRKAEKLSEKAASATGSKGDDITFPSSSIKSMCVTKADDYKEIGKNLGNAISKLNGSSLDTKNKVKRVKSIYNEINSEISQLAEGKGDLGKVTTSFNEILSGVAGAPTITIAGATNTTNSPKHGGLTGSGETFGGVIFTSTVTKFSNDSFSISGARKYSDNLLNAFKEDTKEIPALSSADANKLAVSIVQVCDALIANKRAMIDINREVKDVVKTGDQVVEKLNKASIKLDRETAGAGKLIEGASKNIQAAVKVAKLLPEWHHGFAASVFTAAKAAYNYAARSVSGLDKD